VRVDFLHSSWEKAGWEDGVKVLREKSGGSGKKGMAAVRRLKHKTLGQH